MDTDNQTTHIDELLADVEEAERAVVEAEQFESEARRRKTDASNRSRAAWNAIYDHLLAIAKKSKRSDGFQSSKLAALFKDL